VEKALGFGGQQAECEPTVTVAAMKASSIVGCVNSGDQGKPSTSAQHSLDRI